MRPADGEPRLQLHRILRKPYDALRLLKMGEFMSRHVEAWGGPARHYARPARKAEAVHANSRWHDAVNRVAPQSADIVRQTVRLWNQRIRNQLTSEIGFQLRGRQVSVRVVDGLPAPLSEKLEDTDALALVALNRSLLKDVVVGTRFMESQWDNVTGAHSGDGGTAEPPEVRRVRETAESWLKLLEKHELGAALREINEDVLGAYFFNESEVRIYWLAIGIYAALYSVPVEALTFVVLVHELAHAYTHMGSDIDGHTWSTEEFASTDIAIIEGLAQFYTEVVCSKLKGRMPGALPAFETLLAHQNEVYGTHREWVGKSDRNGGEIVRVSLVECRQSGKQMHRSTFLDTVNRRRKEIQSQPVQSTLFDRS